MNDFNLIEEPWIPVIYHNGNYCRVGIKQALSDAHLIRDIATSNPMDRAGLLRFLLSIVYWCHGMPAPQETSRLGDPLPDCTPHLGAKTNFFCLFGQKHRFYQSPTANREVKIGELFQEIPSGNNFWHFRHVTDKEHGYCPACCALGLLRLPLFSVSGLPDLKSGINGTPPIYVFHYGKSLAQILRKNWLPMKQNLLGTPCWMDPTLVPPIGDPIPLLIGLTVPARKVWLGQPIHHGRCSLCGNPSKHLVFEAHIQSAGTLENSNWQDPHVVYFLNQQQRKSCKAPNLVVGGEFQMDRPYADLMACLLERVQFPATATSQLLIVGFATDKAKNIDVWERTVTLVLNEMQTTAATAFSTWWRSVSALSNNVYTIIKTTPYNRPRGSKPSYVHCHFSHIRPHVEHIISSNMHILVSEPNEGWHEARREFSAFLPMLAQSLSPGVTSQAVQKRRAIAQALPPNPCPKPEPSSSPSTQNPNL